MPVASVPSRVPGIEYQVAVSDNGLVIKAGMVRYSDYTILFLQYGPAQGLGFPLAAQVIKRGDKGVMIRYEGALPIQGRKDSQNW
jgi:hypothetical protein